MDSYLLAASQIIRQQRSVIGPLALDQARKVVGLVIDETGEVQKISGDEKEVLGNLVNQYERLFGRASIEVCRDAIREVNPPIPAKDLPAILQ